MSDLATLTAVEQAQIIRDRRASPVEVTRAVLDRIAAWEPRINAFATLDAEGALNAVDPERQEPQGIEDSIPTFYETTMKGGHNTNNPELVHFLTDNALDSVHWLESLGVEFKDEIGSATGSRPRIRYQWASQRITSRSMS